MGNISGNDELVTKQELKAFYQAILPYLSNGSGGTTYTAGDGIDIINDIISTKKTVNGDLDEVIDQLPVTGNLVSIVNAFNKGDLYSTEERMIGQWANGKPLYKYTYITTSDISIANNSWTSVFTYNESIECVVKAELIRKTTTSDESIFYPLACDIIPGTTTQVKVQVNSSSSVSCKPGTAITIYFTKTTDNPVSIGSANEFSTDEKIIGTWIDGKPLYQKTIEYTVGTVSASQTEFEFENLSGLSLKDYSIVFGWAATSASGLVSTGYWGSTSNYFNLIVRNSKFVIVCSGTHWSNQKATITYKYTKTTD